MGDQGRDEEGTDVDGSVDELDSFERQLKGMVDAAPLAAPPQKLIGETIAGTYTLIEEIGVGGMGQVFLADHERTGGRVALKLIKPSRMDDDTFVRRFELEARHTAALEHPNIVRVFDYGQDDELVYLAMEYVPGRSLEDIIADGPLAPADVVLLCEQILRALEAAHASDLIHRDIKPANILVSGEGHERFVKVLDFGIARALEGPTAGTQGVIGSPHSMAPEQFENGPLSPATDLYAVGCSAYAMLSGRPPFSGKFWQLAVHHCQTPAPRLEDAPTGLADWVAWLLEKDPADRPESARVALNALRDVDLGEPRAPTAIEAREDAVEPAGTIGTTAEKSVSASRGNWFLVAGVVIIGAAFVAFVYSGQPEPASPAAITTARPKEESPRFRIVGEGPLPLATINQGQMEIDPTGKRVVVVEGRRAEVLELASKTVRAIPLPRDRVFQAPSWLHDGEALLVDEMISPFPSVRRLDLDGTLTPMLDLATNAEMSPDGKQLAFFSPRGVMISNADLSEPQLVEKLHSRWQVGGALVWMSDSSGVVYAQYKEEDESMALRYLSRSEARTLHRSKDLLLSFHTVLYAPLPDRGLLYGVRGTRIGGIPTSDLWTAQVSNGLELEHPELLVRGEGFMFNQLSVSRDGEHLVYCRYAPNMDVHIGEFAEDGALRETQTLDGTSRAERNPIWLNEDTLVFMSDRTGSFGIYMQEVGQTSATLISEPGQWATMPAVVGETVLYWAIDANADTVHGARLMAWTQAAGARVLTDLLGTPSPNIGGNAQPTGVDVKCSSSAGVGCVVQQFSDVERTFSHLDLETGALTRIATVPTVDSVVWALATSGESLAFVDSLEPVIRQVAVPGGDEVDPVELSLAKYTVTWLAAAPTGGWFAAGAISDDKTVKANGLLTRIDATGQVQPIHSEEWWTGELDVSPSGRRVAFTQLGGQCTPWELELDRTE